MSFPIPSCSYHLFLLLLPPPPSSTLFPYTTLFRSQITQLQAVIATAQNSPYSLATKHDVRFAFVPYENQASVYQGAEIYSRSEEHTSELQSHSDLVCRLLLEKKKINSDILHIFRN